MKKINIKYWHLSKYPELKYEHNSEYDYSTKKRNLIIDELLNKGFSVMLKIYPNNPDVLVIWIDKGRFGQS